jgi:hypothetical protein
VGCQDAGYERKDLYRCCERLQSKHKAAERCERLHRTLFDARPGIVVLGLEAPAVSMEAEMAEGVAWGG